MIKINYNKKQEMKDLMDLDKLMDNIIPDFKISDPVKKEEVKAEYWSRRKNTIDTTIGLF